MKVKAGDYVSHPSCPLFLRVDSVRAGVAQCSFGTSGKYAGAYSVQPMKKYNVKGK